MATSVEKLVTRLRNEGWEIPDNYKFERLRPGHWQRSAGAWSWRMTAPGFEMGSPDSVARCLKAKELNGGDHGTMYAD